MTSLDVVWWLRRGFVIAICTLLLAGAVYLMSRYTANRRLMKLVKDSGVVSVSWQGTSIDWLRRMIGDDAEEALLCYPVGLMTTGTAEQTSDESIRRLLGELSGLEEITIHNRDLPPFCLEIIATRHRHVESLTFRLPVISHDDARWLSRMQQLGYVDLGQFVREPRENDWSWLKALSKLEALEVTMWGASDRDVMALAECPASRELSLSGPALSDEALNRLCDLPALEYLSLDGANIRLRFPNGRKLPATLYGLDLNWTAVDDESLATVAELPQLNRVSIMVGSVTDAGMETLARLPALRQLWLYELKQLTDDGLKALTASTSLIEIHVERCGTTSQGLLHLMELPNWIDIRFEGIRFHREPGTASPTVTADTVDEFLSLRRRMQEEQDSVHNGPKWPRPFIIP
ncbi:MAG: hypothetical protein H7062_02715 [Candidatus Saccharimonas sp.]|nr:hypothetical protein [Planctomycetaceae bacterium]